MEEEDLQELLSWPDVKTIIESAIDPVLSAQIYNPKKVNDWTTAIVESVLKGLQNLAKSYKYVVTCIIMQKNGAGLNTSSTCYWDAKTDGSCSVRWDNKTLHAIVTVFAVSLIWRLRLKRERNGSTTSDCVNVDNEKTVPNVIKRNQLINQRLGLSVGLPLVILSFQLHI